MNSRKRLLAAIHHEQPDMVPVGLHDIGTLLPHIRRTLGRPITDREALEMFGLDPTLYRGYGKPASDPKWRERIEILSESSEGRLVRRIIETPKGKLTTLERRTEITTWTIEPLLKSPEDLELLRYRPHIHPDSRAYEREFGRGLRDGIVRVGVWGQGEAVELRGPKELCKDLHMRPDWIRELYEMLTDHALTWIEGLPTDYVDLVEIAGHIGNFVSPKTYEKRIMPFDKRVVKALHDKGIPTSYHDCGMVMHVIELIAKTGTDCIETLTPPPFGGDVDLSKAKAMVGGKVCLIGGFHQSLIERGPVEAIERRVRECIDSAADGGGYILYNTDHFFEAPLENLRAYVRAARKYGKYE